MVLTPNNCSSIDMSCCVVWVQHALLSNVFVFRSCVLVNLCRRHASERERDREREVLMIGFQLSSAFVHTIKAKTIWGNNTIIKNDGWKKSNNIRSEWNIMRDSDVDSIMIEYDVSLSMGCHEYRCPFLLSHMLYSNSSYSSCSSSMCFNVC